MQERPNASSVVTSLLPPRSNMQRGSRPTREPSAISVYLALAVVALGPFALASAWVALNLWTWFLDPAVRFTPTYPQMYAAFAVIGLFRTARYVEDGRFRWKDAVTGSLLTPALLLLAGFLIHIATHP
jgi:hypothetical protein